MLRFCGERKCFWVVAVQLGEAVECEYSLALNIITQIGKKRYTNITGTMAGSVC